MLILRRRFLTLQVPTPQNGQTHSKKPTNCLSVFDHFVGLALEGLSLEKLFPVPIL